MQHSGGDTVSTVPAGATLEQLREVEVLEGFSDEQLEWFL